MSSGDVQPAPAVAMASAAIKKTFDLYAACTLEATPILAQSLFTELDSSHRNQREPAEEAHRQTF